MTRLGLLALLGALSGCATYRVTGPVTAGCRDGLFVSFCVVQVPKGSQIVTGTGVLPAIGAATVEGGVAATVARVP